MSSGWAVAVVVTSLAVAAWCLLTAARDRTLGTGQLVGVGVVELLALVLATFAVVRLAGGERPTQLATFIGYLVASVLVLPAGAGLAALERTRWGAAIVGAAALVLPVLVLRLQQVWNG